MNRQCVFSFLVVFILSSLTDCSSAEKRYRTSDNRYIVSHKIEVVPNSPEQGKSAKKKASNLRKPADFIPKKPEIITFSNEDIQVSLYARSFAQGNGVYAEIERQAEGSDPENITLSYKNTDVPVTKTSWGYRSLWGISPEEKPGFAAVIIKYSMDGKDKNLASNILIKDVVFPVSKGMLNVGKFSNIDYTNDPRFRDLIARCTVLLNKAFSSVTGDKIQNTLAFPRDMYKITGDYWRKRIYLKYQKKNSKKTAVEGRKRFHRGVDLKGEVDSPVFAIADGLVILSHSMFFEGDMVIVDHGNQVFSYYQHLDYRRVKEGARVRAGDIIGGVGATGMVTGPHLHVAFSIRGVHVDPLSILSLPVSR